MSEPPKDGAGEPRKRRRRRRKPRRKPSSGGGADGVKGQEGTRASTRDSGTRDQDRKRGSPRKKGQSPWQRKREQEERSRREEASRRAREEDKDLDPRQICVDEPVFLAAGPAADEETGESPEEQSWLDDLVEPEWDEDREWGPTAWVLLPLGRTRLVADAGDIMFLAGDQVVLSAQRGIELGIALEAPRYRPLEGENKNRILRRFGYSDSRQTSRMESRSIEAFDLCKRRIEEHRLDMKLLKVEFLHGGGKAIFYFTAEQRVDFRQLIRDLAAELHARIEMRQVGVRDAAKIMGGVGPCGLRVCCNRFLSRFNPVSIKMAKVQNLMLNPSKVSGICGRLLCCLEYEYTQYREMSKKAPRAGRTIRCKEGRGRIVDVQLLEGRCTVEMQDGTRTTCPWSEIRSPGDQEDAKPDETAPRTEEGGQSEARGEKRRRGGRRKKKKKKQEEPAR